MLQQTRVDTVIPYYRRWMKSYPTLKRLSEASEHQVLRHWEGLGYYSRARNIIKTAKIINQNYKGKLPEHVVALRKLPGIGRYSAAAIASIAYGADQPALDGNIRRVYSRLFNLEKEKVGSVYEKNLERIALQYLPHGDAGDYNQALMDLGALVCLPKKPRCEICPVGRLCQARILGIQDDLPSKPRKTPIPHRIHAAAMITRESQRSIYTLLVKRPSPGLLGGLWEFPNVLIKNGRDNEWTKSILSTYKLRVKPDGFVKTIHHTYSHFRISEHVYRCKLINKKLERNHKWINSRNLKKYPMGKIDRLIASQLIPQGKS